MSADRFFCFSRDVQHNLANRENKSNPAKYELCYNYVAIASVDRLPVGNEVVCQRTSAGSGLPTQLKRTRRGKAMCATGSGRTYARSTIF